MRLLRYTAAAALALPPLQAGAEELNLGFKTEATYNDNVFNDVRNEQDDTFFTFTPLIGVQDRTGDVQWKLNYEPNYLVYLDFGELDDFEHKLRANASWKISEKTTISFNDNFSLVTSRQRFNQEVAGEDDVVIDTEVEFGDVREILRNIAGLTVAHQLSARESLSGAVNYSFTDFEVGRDTENLSFRTSYRRTLSSKSTLGLGGSWSRAETEGAGRIQATSTDFYGMTGSWDYTFEPGFTLSLSAGPTWIESEQEGRTGAIVVYDAIPLVVEGDEVFLADPESCSPVGDGTNFVFPSLSTLVDCERFDDISVSNDDQNTLALFEPRAETIPPAPDPGTRLTFFANMSIQKVWRRWTANLSYRRQESPSSGIGAATINDTVTGTLRWQPGERWNISLAGTWSRRTQATESNQFVVLVDTVDNAPSLLLKNTLVPALPVFLLGRTGAAATTSITSREIDTNAELNQYIGRLNIRYRLRRRLTLLGTLYYTSQKQSGDALVIGRDLDRFNVSVGFRWDFDPIKF